MADGFKEVLESKSRRIRRWATRREIERHNYTCELWPSYGEDFSWNPDFALTLDRYLTGIDPDGAAHSQNRNWYAPYQGEVWNYVHGQFDWVDELIMSFGRSDPDAMGSLIKSVEDVPEYLLGKNAWRDETKLSDMNRLDGGSELAQGYGAEEYRNRILLASAMQELTYWTGATATAYTRTFGGLGENWEEVCENNYLLAECLIGAVNAQMAVYLTARESVTNVCDKTIEALWGVNEGIGDEEGWSPSASSVITVIGAVTGLIVTAATFGTMTVPVVAAAFAISSTIALEIQKGSGNTEATGDPEGEAGPTQIEISGSTPVEVLESMRNHLETIQSSGSEEEERIRTALRDAYSAAADNADARTKFEITFADDTPTDDMGEREVSLTTGDLEHAATVLFPQSADRVLGAHDVLATSSDGGAAFASEWHAGPTTVQGPWLALRDLLQDLTAANAEKIRYAGDFLLKYAIEVGEVDETSAANLDETYEHLDTEIETSGREHGAYVPADHLSAG